MHFPFLLSFLPLIDTPGKLDSLLLRSGCNFLMLLMDWSNYDSFQLSRLTELLVALTVILPASTINAHKIAKVPCRLVLCSAVALWSEQALVNPLLWQSICQAASLKL